MKIKKTRNQVIEALIDDDIQIINDNPDYIYNILNEGFKGYVNYTNKELKDEFTERLNPDSNEILIVKIKGE